MLRHIRFSRFGLAEDPTRQIVVTSDGKLYEVTGTYRREFPSGVMLTVKHFNGEQGPDIAASAVRLVLPD